MNEIICAYCHTSIENIKDDMVICNNCGTPYHNECWQECEHCSTYGCGCDECHSVFDVSFPRYSKGHLFPVKPVYNSPQYETPVEDYSRVTCNNKDIYTEVSDNLMLKNISSMYHIELGDHVEYHNFDDLDSEGYIDKIYISGNINNIKIDLKDKDSETILEKASLSIIKNNITYKRERSVNLIGLAIGIIMFLTMALPILGLFFK